MGTTESIFAANDDANDDDDENNDDEEEEEEESNVKEPRNALPPLSISSSIHSAATIRTGNVRGGGLPSSSSTLSSREPSSLSVSGGRERQRQQIPRGGPPTIPMLQLHGAVVGMDGCGKRTLLQRLQGKDPFDNNNEQQQQQVVVVPYQPRNNSKRNSNSNGQPPPQQVVWDRIRLLVRASQSVPINHGPLDFLVVLLHPNHKTTFKNYLKSVVQELLVLQGYNEHQQPQQQDPIRRPICLCLLLNFRDIVYKLQDVAQQEADVTSLTMKLLLNNKELTTTTETNKHVLDQQKLLLQFGWASLKNCYGLDLLHHFIYQSYLQRKKWDLENSLFHVSRAQTQTKLSLGAVLESYDQFLQRIQPDKLKNEDMSHGTQRQPKARLAVGSPQPPMVHCDRTTITPNSTGTLVSPSTSAATSTVPRVTMVPLSGSASLEAFLALSSDDDETETDDKGGNVRVQGRFAGNESDDDDDDDDFIVTGYEPQKKQDTKATTLKMSNTEAAAPFASISNTNNNNKDNNDGNSKDQEIHSDTDTFEADQTLPRMTVSNSDKQPNSSLLDAQQATTSHLRNTDESNKNNNHTASPESNKNNNSYSITTAVTATGNSSQQKTDDDDRPSGNNKHLAQTRMPLTPGSSAAAQSAAEKGGRQERDIAQNDKNHKIESANVPGQQLDMGDDEDQEPRTTGQTLAAANQKSDDDGDDDDEEFFIPGDSNNNNPAEMSPAPSSSGRSEPKIIVSPPTPAMTPITLQAAVFPSAAASDDDDETSNGAEAMTAEKKPSSLSAAALAAIAAAQQEAERMLEPTTMRTTTTALTLEVEGSEAMAIRKAMKKEKKKRKEEKKAKKAAKVKGGV